ncbi:CMRF35-like molecule 8 [Ctenopharyngodon idella]|uniref:CMRF35-like molecule 8 n=1 Tax=Ctenopharyngodon idella TaxID=7959 RepID=UPI002232754E|nr:CMRF35-like molecule 8 [Ctenopharyngodon idella]
MNIILTFTLLMIPGVMTYMSITGYSRGGVTIKCKYEKKYTQKTKYFCRGQKPDTLQIGWCSDLIRTEEKDKWVQKDRFSLYDDARSAVFNVTIRDLTERDSGTYYCAVDIPKEIDFYTEVKLNVLTNQNTFSPPLLSSSSSSSSSPISQNSQLSSTSDFTSASPSISNGLFLIIGVTVILLLLITGFMSCIMTLYKKHLTRDPDSASKKSEPGTENSEAVHQMLYEEIKDTRLHTDCKTSQLLIKPSDLCNTVYATPQLPTNPSDSSKTVYATPQLPTNPSDSSNTVYATPQLPTNPSDSSKTVYATPQLPTNPSDSSNTVYATPLLGLLINSSDTNTVYATV